MENIKDKRLYRSQTNKKISGVIGGIGEYFGIDPTLLRVFYILLTVFSGFFPGIIAYIFMAIIMPERAGRIEAKKVESSESKIK